ncbi:MAG: hypothetical protein JWL71_4258 [Acidobacteria bacterium]|nr:hypothetical protein [Acidobacteriota bacterium]
MILIAALVVAAAIAWAALQIVAEMRASRGGGADDRTAALLALFAPALTDTQRDPRAFLVWQPIAKAARQLFPAEFAALDRAMGSSFPFPPERIEAAHSQWTADWLAWELAHDTEYKLKAAIAEHDLASQAGSAVARARLDGVEREKLDLYQRRYADYVRTAKALQALLGA